MRRFFLAISLFSLFTTSASAQVDSVILHRVFNSELTATSDTLVNGKPYAYFNARMAKGDAAYIRYESKDYIVALAIQDSFGHSTLKEDDGTFFKTIGSSITMPFRAEEEGQYYFIFTSRDRKATGKFKAELYYYNSAADKVTTESPLCEKLRYITDQSIIGFEFVKGEKREAFMFDEYTPKVDLLPGASCSITNILDNVYTCTLSNAKDLNVLKTRYKDLDMTIKECLPGTVRKEYSLADIPESDKKDFVKKVEYSMPGEAEGDHNTTHSLQKIKYKVTLEIHKSEADTYTLRLDVE